MSILKKKVKVFYKFVYGCTEDHELMSNYELQENIKDYYGKSVAADSTFDEFKLYCTDDIVLDVLSYCCRFGNFRIRNAEKPQVRNTPD